MVRLHFDAEAHAQHLRFARREAVENLTDGFRETRILNGLGGRHRLRILEEVAQMRIIVVADRRFHGNRLLGDLHDLEHLFLGELHQTGEFSGIGLDARFLQHLARDAVHAVDGFDHMNRNADGAGLVGDGARDGLTDPPGGVSGELVAAAVFELVDRLHETDVAFLNQIEELQTAVGVLLRDRDDETQVRLGHFLLGVAGFGFARRHLLVGVE